MLDLNSLTTRKGARIILHMQDEGDIEIMKVQLTQKLLARKLEYIVENFDGHNSDTGAGTVVHVLMNDEGETIGVYSDTEYAEWEKTKIWRHNTDPMTEALKELMGEITGGSNYKGPSVEQYKAYMKDPVADELSTKAAMDKNCPLCIVPEDKCPMRIANFNQPAFEAELAARKA